MFTCLIRYSGASGLLDPDDLVACAIAVTDGDLLGLHEHGRLPRPVGHAPSETCLVGAVQENTVWMVIDTEIDAVTSSVVVGSVERLVESFDEVRLELVENIGRRLGTTLLGHGGQYGRQGVAVAIVELRIAKNRSPPHGSGLRWCLDILDFLLSSHVQFLHIFG